MTIKQFIDDRYDKWCRSINDEYNFDNLDIINKIIDDFTNDTVKSTEHWNEEHPEAQIEGLDTDDKEWIECLSESQKNLRTYCETLVRKV